jgi:hypothetical protein
MLIDLIVLFKLKPGVTLRKEPTIEMRRLLML